MKKVVSLLCGLVLLGGGVGNHAHADDTIVLNFETGLGSQSVQQVRTLQAWSASVEEASKAGSRYTCTPTVRWPSRMSI